MVRRESAIPRFKYVHTTEPATLAELIADCAAIPAQPGPADQAVVPAAPWEIDDACYAQVHGLDDYH